MSIKQQLKEIKDNFILCGKPKFTENETVEWTTSLVRLDLIKTIHFDEKICKNNKDQCIFYTYKDEWYICAVNFALLTTAVNNYLNKNKGLSHGCEVKEGNDYPNN